MQPPICLSSYLTSQLLTFRNPEGREENWLNSEENNLSFALLRGKVITAEIGIALLCVTSTIETVVYAVLGIVSGAFAITSSLLSTTPRDFGSTKIFALFSSSRFTVYWNLGNLAIFNLFCRNAFTNESLARYSMDHWPRGELFKTCIKVSIIALNIIAFIFSKRYLNLSTNRLSSDRYDRCLRSEDLLYIYQWAAQNNLTDITSDLPEQQPQALLSAAVKEAMEHVSKGKEFFNNFIVNKADGERFKECDPEIYPYILTKSIYIYVFGEKKEENLPAFFKDETQRKIKDLRIKYKNETPNLEFLFENMASFDNNKNLNDTQKAIFKNIQDAAYAEMQGSLFLTECTGYTNSP